MKLVYCSACHDVVRLIEAAWRRCQCGLAGGQYNRDSMTATVGGGYARVFGIGNPFFDELFPYLSDDGKASMRQKYYGQPNTDCWWGEFSGDVQIFRIASPSGPRLRMRVVRKDATTNRLTIVDKREYSVAGKRLTSVIVPSNPVPSFRGSRKRKKKAR